MHNWRIIRVIKLLDVAYNLNVRILYSMLNVVTNNLLAKEQNASGKSDQHLKKFLF